MCILGFSLRKASLQYVGNKGIYSVGKDLVKQNDKLAKQNVSRVFYEKALPARHLRKL